MDTANPTLNILVVEDNEILRESIVDALGGRGHHVRGIDCAEALPEQIDLLRLDLAILDLNLPGEDGLSLAGRLRATHPELGIIMLTARINLDDRIAGYTQGADIYLTKPAALAELEQAIRALARRLKPAQRHAESDQVCLDCVRQVLVLPDGQTRAVTSTEAALLVAFVRAAQNILETWQIAEILGMDTAHLNKPAMELHLVRLRKKLPAFPGKHSSLRAIRGRGYQLCLPLQLK